MIAQNAKMSLNAIWVHKADQYAAEGNVRGIRLMNVVASQIIPFLLLAVPSFLAVYYGVGALEGFLAAVPVQVTNALITAGKLLPALGLALLFQQMFTKELIPFLIIGFTLAAYLGLNMMAISLIGVSLGLLHWVYTSRKVEQ